MRIVSLNIRNYKSLKSFDFEPAGLSIIVGANASGKSNLADCIGFIAEVYRHGLEIGVARKGGYENIAFRKVRRSKQPVGIRISMDFAAIEFSRLFGPEARSMGAIRINHFFQFVARSSSIRAPFEVVTEELTIVELTEAEPRVLVSVKRTGDTYEVDTPGVKTAERRGTGTYRGSGIFDLHFFNDRRPPLAKTDLVISMIGRFIPGMYAFLRAVEGIRVFQINPTKTREFGVPTPAPELDRSGANLPAVIDLLQKKHRQEWKLVLQTMRSVLPDLEAINVGYTPSRTLGLFFKESGSGRPWTVEEVSDGTVQTLALLVAIFDPASTTLVIEEPENSIHPWIIRHVIDACREAAGQKQILITTHSPIVINAVRPDQVWVIWKSNGESQISRLPELDVQFLPMWQEGAIPTFEYLDTGALPQALPPPPTQTEEGE
jgi:predicted ATPase